MHVVSTYSETDCLTVDNMPCVCGYMHASLFTCIIISFHHCSCLLFVILVLLEL
jgi:hypothetical protein